MNSKTLAPVLIFCYKRLNQLKKTISALQKNKLSSQTEIYIFSDGAKTESEKPTILELREYLKSISGFKEVIIKESIVNKGLANSIISGVTQILEQYDRVIVLEDDLVASPNFLCYMNQALSAYFYNKKVFSVSGYSYPFNLPQSYSFDAYAVTRGCSWGWATWKDRWDGVDWNAKTFYEVKGNRKIFSKFSFSGSDLPAMLDKQMNGKIDSWAIRWYFQQFLNRQLTVYPVRSFIINEGFNSDATHTNVYNRYKTMLDSGQKTSFNFPTVTSYNPYFQKKIQYKFSILSRIIMGRGMTFFKKLGLVKD